MPSRRSTLHHTGARSITLAPETGSDRLRALMNKPITNDEIVQAVETAQGGGIVHLKMYFIIGLPGETDADVTGIADLVRQVQESMIAHGRERGRVGTVHAGFNVLVPKPYTPYAREAMLTRQEVRRRMRLVEGRLDGVANLRIEQAVYRSNAEGRIIKL